MKFAFIKKLPCHPLNIALILLIILGTLYILLNHKEPFLTGGQFPSSVTKGILAPPNGDYTMKKKGVCTPGLSNYTYQDEWRLQPPQPIGSYAQVTNNKKNWSTPCNGTSIPPSICGGLYNKKKNTKTKKRKSPPIISE